MFAKIQQGEECKAKLGEDVHSLKLELQELRLAERKSVHTNNQKTIAKLADLKKAVTSVESVKHAAKVRKCRNPDFDL